MFVEVGGGCAIRGSAVLCVHVRMYLVEEGPDDVDEHLSMALHALLACLFVWDR